VSTGTSAALLRDIAATLAAIHAFLAGEVVAEVLILTDFVGHDGGFFGDVRLDNRDKIGGFRAFNVKGTNFAALAINKRENCVLVGIAALFGSSLRRAPQVSSI
jgi:hypothetical protein